MPGATEFDPARPNAARVYNYLLGGKDNYAVDRETADQLLRALPEAAVLARANRAFMAAAVRQVAAYGVTQFVDIGTGLPVTPNVHDCARSVNPGARVTYVDNDPFVVAHSRALLATDDLVTVVNGDARDSAAILADPELNELLDLREPVCVLLVSVLHFMTPEQADAAAATFRERLAPGSCLVISAGHRSELHRPAEAPIQAAYGARTILAGRSVTEIAAFFGDFELVPPGLVPVTDWSGDPSGPPPDLSQAAMLAGIGRKVR